MYGSRAAQICACSSCGDQKAWRQHVVLQGSMLKRSGNVGLQASTIRHLFSTVNHMASVFIRTARELMLLMVWRPFMLPAWCGCLQVWG